MLLPLLLVLKLLLLLGLLLLTPLLWLLTPLLLRLLVGPNLLLLHVLMLWQLLLHMPWLLLLHGHALLLHVGHRLLRQGHLLHDLAARWPHHPGRLLKDLQGGVGVLRLLGQARGGHRPLLSQHLGRVDGHWRLWQLDGGVGWLLLPLLLNKLLLLLDLLLG